MSRNIVFEGWLTKSPPMKRIWRTKWRRRWFALRQGELPGQYFLDYYADRNCRRLKGTINLDLCEQVDAGLHMERSGHGILDPKLRGSVFTIQTQSRTYHLEADCEAEMEKWVDAICRVCGLRSTEDANTDACQNTYMTRSTMTDTYSGPGPYIPISECITGVRDQGSQRAFTFDSKNIDMLTTGRSHKLYTSQPHIRHNNPELSENDSNISDDECRSLSTSQSNIQNLRPAAKSFTKLAITTDHKMDGVSDDVPPVPPPRPPKTFQATVIYHGPKILEPTENQELRPAECTYRVPHSSPRHWSPRRYSQGAPPSSCRLVLNAATLQADFEDETLGHPSMQYCNLSSLPPAVDRALKPRHSSIGHTNHTILHSPQYDEIKSDVLQYLDLDLKTSDSPSSRDASRRNVPVIHGKSYSAADTESVYKTVDFLKTEAFNSTRQDAEASRSKPLSVTIN